MGKGKEKRKCIRHSQSVIDRAKELYLEGKGSRKIADILNLEAKKIIIAFRTINEWITKGGWKKEREMKNVAFSQHIMQHSETHYYTARKITLESLTNSLQNSNQIINEYIENWKSKDDDLRERTINSLCNAVKTQNDTIEKLYSLIELYNMLENQYNMFKEVYREQFIKLKESNVVNEEQLSQILDIFNEVIMRHSL